MTVGAPMPGTGGGVAAAPGPHRRFDAVLFDVDGVLVDTGEAVVALWRRVCELHGRPAASDDEREHIIGCAAEHTARQLFPDADADTLKAVLSSVRELEPELSVLAVPGAAAAVRAVRAGGVPVALVTGASDLRLSRVVAALGLHGAVDAAVTWGQAPGKPDPGPYLLAAERVGVPADRCLAVEDSPAGVASAVAAGAVCAAITPDGGPAAQALLDSGASAVLPAVSQIPSMIWPAGPAERLRGASW